MPEKDPNNVVSHTFPRTFFMVVGVMVFAVIWFRWGNAEPVVELREVDKFIADPVSVMGPVTAQITIYPDSKITVPVEEAYNAAIAEIRHIDKLMSSYRPDSDIGKLNRIESGVRLAVDPLTWQVVMESLRYHRLSNGAFDITYRPAAQLYSYPKEGDKKVAALPPPEQIEKARQAIGSQHLLYTREGMRIGFARPGMSVGLGGIAKGFAVDRAIRVLQQLGVKNALVEIGGEVRVIGKVPLGTHTKQEIGTEKEPNEGTPAATSTTPHPPTDRPWTTGIRNPRFTPGAEFFIQVLKRTNAAIATSGDYESYFEIGNKRYSHIIDPRTGYPVQGGVVSATVISQNSCLQADALATAVSVLGVDEAKTFLRQFTGVEAWLYRLDKNGTLDPTPIHIGPFPTAAENEQ